MSTTYPYGTLGAIGLEYPLEWLDIFVTVSLNPQSFDHNMVEPATAAEIIDHLRDEEYKLQVFIKSQSFSLNEDDIGILIKRFQNLLIALLDQCLENQQVYEEKQGTGANEIFEAAIQCIEGLLSFIEKWFSNYLSLDERVTPNYLAVTKSELKKRLKRIKDKIDLQQHSSAVIKLVVKRINQFIKLEKYPFEVTFKAVLYKKELVSKLEEINWDLPSMDVVLEIHQLLIYMNFNSKTYIKLFTGALMKRVDEEATEPDRMEKLLFYYKAFNQIHSKPGTILNPGFHDLEIVLKTWFDEEIGFLEKKMQLPPVIKEEESKPEPPKEKPAVIKQKITCALSSDQIGLILRAADEAKLVFARSLNEVFKTIVPHLSTPRKESLSYESVRTKAYGAEDNDKQIAISILEKMITKIKDY